MSRAAGVRTSVLDPATARAAVLLDARALSQVLEISERAVRMRAAAENWPCQTKPVRGGRAKMFPLARLPAWVREAVLARQLATGVEGLPLEGAEASGAVPAQASGARPLGPGFRRDDEGGLDKGEAVKKGAVPSQASGVRPLGPGLRRGGGEGAGAEALALPVPAPPPVTVGRVLLRPGELAVWQRRCMQARAAIMVHVRALAVEAGVNAALRVVARQAAAGTLPPALAAQVPLANARAGESGGRSLSLPTLKRWWGVWNRSGFSALSLVPQATSRGPLVPVWAAPFLAAWRLPSKPSVPDALSRMVLPDGVARPSENQARLFLSRLPVLEREKGRMGPAAMKALRPFIRRATDGMEPLDIVIADGFTAKHDVAHPIHGRPFAPELTVVRCVVTRRVIGWSAGLAESTWTVMDAYADAARKAGLWAVAYTDNGAGFRSKLNIGELAGLQGRLGATHSLGTPGNPQARGQIERGWDRLFIQPAKLLPSFKGADMDEEARRRISRRIDQDIKQHGASPLLQEWADFLRWAGDCVAAYNAAPHQGLPRMRDPVTGKRRHLSPDEAWRNHLDQGWTPIRLPPEEADDLFRPHVVRQVRRGEVLLFNNAYFHADLADHHGETVQVGFDIHDPSRVWVRRLSGVLIAVAEAGGNVRPYIDRLRLDRARRRLRPVEAKRAEILAELGLAAEGAGLIEGVALPVEPAVAVPGGDDVRPDFFASDLAMYAWCAAHPDQATPHDRTYLAEAAAGDARLARAMAEHDRRHGTALSSLLLPLSCDGDTP